jgi:tetratricopeptide (TPR) repeat protein
MESRLDGSTDMKMMIPDYMTPRRTDAGEVLLSAGLYREAFDFLKKSHESDPRNPRHMVTFGLCLFYHDRFDDAEAMLRQVTTEYPDKGMGWHALGNIVEGLGRFDEALKCYQKALEVIKDQKVDSRGINYGVASNLLRAGRFQEAWPYWENGRAVLSVDHVPMWNGEDLKGKKLLVIREGGYGDVLWLLRYFPLLQSLGAQVNLYAYSGLRGLLSKHPWVDTYCDSENIVETGDYDYQISLMSIMAILGYCPVGMDGPYFLSRNPVKRNGRKRVGICWKAGEHGGVVRKIRTIPVEEIEPLKDVDVEWVNLQLGEKCPSWFKDDQEAIKGWHKTADMIASCDAVVSCDTALLHLAAGMNKPTVGIIPLNFEWKWAYAKQWYPSLHPVFSDNPISFAGIMPKVAETVRQIVS